MSSVPVPATSEQRPSPYCSRTWNHDRRDRREGPAPSAGRPASTATASSPTSRPTSRPGAWTRTSSGSSRPRRTSPSGCSTGGCGPSALDDADRRRPGRTSTSRRSTTRTSSTTRRPKPKPKLDSMDEVDPELREMFDKLGISLAEQERHLAASRSTRSSTRSRSPRPSRSKLAEVGVIFCSFSEAVRNHPELVQKYLGTVVPYRDNFFATLNSAVFTDGSFCFIPAGVQVPDGAVDLLPHQHRRNRPVRAHADRRRGRRDASATSRAARRPSATPTSCTPRSSSWSRSTTPTSSTRPCRTGTRATRTASAASTTSSPSAACARAATRRSPGPRSRPARRSPGSTRACCSRRRLGRRVLLGRGHHPPPAGRHRHQDDPHRQEHAQHDRLQGHLGRPADNSYRGLVKMLRSADGARNHTQCDSMLIGDECGAHTFPYIEVKNATRAGRARGVDVQDRRGPAVLLPPARHLRRGRRLDDRATASAGTCSTSCRWSSPSRLGTC